MNEDSFFEEQKEQSQVKTAIVQKYFDAWAKIMIKKARAERIAYIDLFAGPGRYKDATKSTPLLILEKAVQDPELRTRLVSRFNDKNSDNSRSLQTAISEIPGLEALLDFYEKKPSVSFRILTLLFVMLSPYQPATNSSRGKTKAFFIGTGCSSGFTAETW